jgi:perosamine synthetase
VPDWDIPLFKIQYTESDIEAVVNVIRRGMSWAEGEEINQFEQQLAQYLRVGYAVAVNSGTSALHLMLLAAGIRGKEVIIPAFTFIATANAVVLADGIPVFADIETDTFGLDVADVENKITANTGAIILVHYAGIPARDTLALRKLAVDYGLYFFEDAAECLGGQIVTGKVGSFGYASALSFCQNKIITCGEGGAVVTNYEEIATKVRSLRSHGRISAYFLTNQDVDYTEAGYNNRMSSMCAALGLSQLTRIKELITYRRRVAIWYYSDLSGIKDIKRAYYKGSVFQMYPILLDSEHIRDSLQEFLSIHGVMSKVFFRPIYSKTAYSRNLALPNTEDISRRILCLPMYVNLTLREVESITSLIMSFFVN